MALAKNVQTKGRVSVTSSPLNMSVRKNAITETKKRIQYRVVCFLVVSIIKFLGEINTKTNIRTISDKFALFKLDSEDPFLHTVLYSTR